MYDLTKYRPGFFKTQPTRHGAITRLSLAIASKRPWNGSVYASHCFGEVRVFDVFLPEFPDDTVAFEGTMDEFIAFLDTPPSLPPAIFDSRSRRLPVDAPL